MTDPTEAPELPDRYEDREARLDEILDRLDRSDIPMDELAAEAREAAALIASMHATIRDTRGEIADALGQLERIDETPDELP